MKLHLTIKGKMETLCKTRFKNYLTAYLSGIYDMHKITRVILGKDICKNCLSVLREKIHTNDSKNAFIIITSLNKLLDNEEIGK